MESIAHPSCYSVRDSCSRNQLDPHARFHPCNPVACGKVDCGDSGQGDSVLGATYATERPAVTMCIPFVIPSTISGSCHHKVRTLSFLQVTLKRLD